MSETTQIKKHTQVTLSSLDGFTLLELMIVLAIIGITTAMGVYTYSNMLPHIRLKDAASEIYAEMNGARMKSISSRVDYTFLFDTTSETYTVRREGGAVSDPRGTEWKGIDVYKDTNDPDVPPFTADTVTFRPDGSAGLVGFQAVYLRNKPYTGERYRVSVLGSTGKLKMEQWKGSSWESGY